MALGNPTVVGLWRFDEGSGTNVIDSSGLGNNGTLMGENGNIPARVSGQPGFGGALYFTNNGVDHAYANIPAANSLMIGQTATNAWTITLWAYEDSDGTGDFISDYAILLGLDDAAAFSLGSGASGDAEMYTWSEIHAAWQLGWGTDSGVTPILDQWVHWAVVYDGTNLTVYRNANQGDDGGISSVPVTSPLTFPGYDGAITIGSELDEDGTANWNGMLDDVAIFNGALTQDQIATVMSGNFSSFMGGPIDVVSQPRSQAVKTGSNVAFGIGVAGQAPFQYQWYFNGAKLSGTDNPTATNATLALTDVQSNQAGTYTVIVSNGSESVTNQATLSVFGQSLVGLWRFDEGDGTNILDSSGLENNGFIAGENGNVPAWVAGHSGGALYFTNDGADHAYVSIPRGDSLMIGQTATNPWTVTAWVYEDSDGTGDFIANYGRVMALDDGVTLQFESGASGDAEMYTWSEIDPTWQVFWGTDSGVTPILDQWVHWAMVYDGTNLTVYRNANQGDEGGVAFVPVTAPLTYQDYTGILLIGSELDQTGDRNWNGMLDDVAVFNVALSQSQIQTVMSGDFSSFTGGLADITSQPQSQNVRQGSNVTFSVSANGQMPLQYQWYFNGAPLLSADNPTATNATLVLTNVQVNRSGVYSVVISNSLGSITSHSAALSVAKASLVGLWRFNEGSGTNVFDSSGFGNNGFLIGENGNVPAWVAGQAGFGGALYLTNNGADHAGIVIPATDSLLIGETETNPWTITLWAYEDSDGTGDFVANYGRFLVIDDGTALQLESGASGDGEFYTWSRANEAWQVTWGFDSDISPLLDQWEHWALVYDGTNLTLYRNGNQGPDGGVETMPVTAAIGGYPDFTNSIIIGTELDQGGDRNWNGMLDDVAVFDVALSQSQIQKVMSGNFSDFTPPPSSPPQLSLGVSAGNLMISWPSAQSTYQLQSTTNLASPNWSNVSTSVVTNGDTLTVTLPIGPGMEFFRLVGN
ncbi:MAG TPA: LamG-like jellyroll fold domain-containing protein [Verrucomicrobiae bacterium]|nr:LamG-like jellyroll fold domain-containing protein [Verrucomicrobiae bacterium]